MPPVVSPLYEKQITGLRPLLVETLEKGLSRTPGSRARIFFRADDIGVPSRAFFDMIRLFEEHRTPLCLAFVPTWLTGGRWQTIRRSMGDASLFCCHQHGWRHTNHECQGKKQEFGDSRKEARIRRDLKCGRDRLAGILGDDFSPFFTPPWNRCGAKTLDILPQLGFLGVSRSSNALPPPPAGLPDYFVNVDLHTRKEDNHDDSLRKLLGEIKQASASGTMGIMLHHQRMNGHAFALLDQLLGAISTLPELEKVSFNDFTN